MAWPCLHPKVRIVRLSWQKNKWPVSSTLWMRISSVEFNITPNTARALLRSIPSERSKLANMFNYSVTSFFFFLLIIASLALISTIIIWLESIWYESSIWIAGCVYPQYQGVVAERCCGIISLFVTALVLFSFLLLTPINFGVVLAVFIVVLHFIYSEVALEAVFDHRSVPRIKEPDCSPTSPTTIFIPVSTPSNERQGSQRIDRNVMRKWMWLIWIVLEADLTWAAVSQSDFELAIRFRVVFYYNRSCYCVPATVSAFGL